VIGRIVVGFAVAVSGIADVAYLSEIASVWDEDDGRTQLNLDQQVVEEEGNVHRRAGRSRGSVVSVNEACISIGFLISYGVAHALEGVSSTNEGWRYMFGVGGIFAFLQFLGMHCLPESPVWLESKGRFQESETAKYRIRGISQRRFSRRTTLDASPVSSVSYPSSLHNTTSVNEELNPSRLADCCFRMLVNLSSIPAQLRLQFRSLRDDILPYKRQFVISIWLSSFQQFCGHPSVLNYSAELFALLDGGRTDASTEHIFGIGILKVVTTLFVIVFIEKTSRKVWLLSGCLCILVSLSFLCIAFIGHTDQSIAGSVELQSTYFSLKNKLGIAGINGVAIGYACSFGPLTWLITSEIFDPFIRGRALGLSTIVSYLAAGLVSRTFLSLHNAIGLSGTFLLYLLATFLSICFIHLGIPDTSEKTPNEINCELDAMWLYGCIKGRRRKEKCIPSKYGTNGEVETDDEEVETEDERLAPSTPLSTTGMPIRRCSSAKCLEIT